MTWQRMRWLDGIIGSMVMSVSKWRDVVKDREAWRAAVHRIAKSWAQLINSTATTPRTGRSCMDLWVTAGAGSGFRRRTRCWHGGCQTTDQRVASGCKNLRSHSAVVLYPPPCYSKQIQASTQISRLPFSFLSNSLRILIPVIIYILQ